MVNVSSEAHRQPGVRLYLTFAEAVTLLTLLDDHVQLEREEQRVQRIHKKLRGIMGFRDD